MMKIKSWERRLRSGLAPFWPSGCLRLLKSYAIAVREWVAGPAPNAPKTSLLLAGVDGRSGRPDWFALGTTGTQLVWLYCIS
jgi:hypothetical protein